MFDVFAQAALLPGFNVQAEFVDRSTDEGDRQLRFDPDLFDHRSKRDIDGKTARAGLRISPSPQSNIIGSFIYNTRDTNQKFPSFPVMSTAQDSIQGEVRYLFSAQSLNFRTGFSLSKLDQTDTIGHKNSAYIYSDINFPDSFIWTLGLSADDYEESGTSIYKLNPKFGVQWQVSNNLRLRLAAFQTLKPSILSNRTIEPTQVAGFNQFFDDANGTESWLYGLGVDARLTNSVYAGMEITGRDQDEQLRIRNEWSKTDRDERAYLFWVPGREWAVTSEVQLDVFASFRLEWDLVDHHRAVIAVRKLGEWLMDVLMDICSPNRSQESTGMEVVETKRFNRLSISGATRHFRS